MTESAEIVGDNDGLARTEEIIAQNTKVVVEAERGVAAAEVEVTRLQSDDPGSTPVEERPAVQPEAGFYADVAMEAMGGAAVKTLKTMGDAIQDMDPGKFGGMRTFEDVIKEDVAKADRPARSAEAKTATKDALGGSVGRATTRTTAAATTDIMGDKLPRSIRTAFQKNVMADIETASGSINGKDKISGAQVNQASVATLQGQALQQTLAKTLSMQHAGNAIKHKADIHAQMGQAKMAGLSPDGAAANPNQHQSATLNLNNRAPSAPNFKDTNATEDTAQA